MSVPTPTRTPVPTTTPAPRHPSKARIAGYAAMVTVVAAAALVAILALTGSWVWAILACAVAGRTSVIVLRLAGVPNPLPWNRDRR